METPTLKRVRRLDSIQLDKTYFTEEGYLIDHPIVTSVGIFEYTNPDGSTRRELRLPEDVFAPESLASYKGKPIIITHDAGYVDKGNVEEETIGTILSEGYQDGDNVRAEIIIHNTDAMKQCGLRELSLGYNLRLEETPGVWEGQPYDAIQRDIVINHLALVGQARAGEQARLNIDARDSNTTLKGGKLMSDKKTRKDGMMSPDEMNAAVEAFKQRRAERMKSGDEGVAEDTVTDTAVAQEGDEGVTETPTPPPRIIRTVCRWSRTVVTAVTPRATPKIWTRPWASSPSRTRTSTLCLVSSTASKLPTWTSTARMKPPAAEEDGDDTNCDEDKPKENADRADSATDFRELLRVVRIGDRLNMDGLESMSVKNAKKAVLKKLKPSLRLDGKSAAYVNAAFDMAVSDMKTRKDTNYQRQQMMNKDSKTTTKAVGSAADARQKMIDRRMKKEEK